MRFSVCFFEDPGYRYSHFLYDYCKYLCYTIEEAGFDCCMVRNRMYSDRMNIIIGAHNITDTRVYDYIRQSGSYVIAQSEVLRENGLAGWPDHPCYQHIFVPLMRQACQVWDGLEANQIHLRQLGVTPEKGLTRFGYLRGMEEVRHKKNKDIDFLYYGSPTPHRTRLIERLQALGGNVVCVFDEAAIFRNDLIARARINIAPNQSPEVRHLTSRTFYLLNNRSIVTVERCVGQEWVEHCFPFADTEQWPAMCMETLHHPHLDELADEYFERYKQLNMVPLIQPMLEKLERQMPERLKRKCSAPPQDDAKQQIKKATESAADLHVRGKTDQAVEALINAIKDVSDAPQIYHEMIRILIDAKRFSEAREVIATLPEEARHDLNILRYAAYVQAGLQFDDDALNCAETILSRDPADAAALNLKGVLAFKAGDKKTAAEYFQKAMDANPGYGEAYANLGELHWDVNEKEKAFACFRKGFELSPGIADVSSLYYSIATALGRLDEAEADFKEASVLHPTHKNLVFLYIDLLIHQTKYAEAMRVIEDALVLFGADEGTLAAALAVRAKLGPRRIDASAKKNTLSLCMTVKNAEKDLASGLRSVRDLVDEMVIVDTGSTDQTKAIARVFGAMVYDCVETDHFAAARAHALNQAQGDWVLVLDADEIISPLDHDELKLLLRNKNIPGLHHCGVRKNFRRGARL